MGTMPAPFAGLLCPDSDATRRAVLAASPKAKHASSGILDRLAREFELKDQLDGAWAYAAARLEYDGVTLFCCFEGLRGQPPSSCL